ncbi:MAG: tRNA N6-adenosine threonylcarbamoyltransferase [Patescibacteria group bacterium]|nr:tRNA N6-adenosine threonylcarbamoyltransferase [Patescibacteria group bacterium]
MIILAIETSCDETASAIIKADGKTVEVLSNVVYSQIKLHSRWGGVVPNLAAREHLKNIVPVVKKSLSRAKLCSKDIDLIAVTQGPGLIPALLIGTNAAKTLAYLWKKPLIGIHHIEGHIYANFIFDKIRVSTKSKIPNPKKNQGTKLQNSKQTGICELNFQNPNIKFPILCLVVSGGHTQLVLMKKHLDYEIVGQTLDDAAGEAFDKVARILDLGYPGGPAIALRAMEFPISKSQFPNNFKIQNSKLVVSLSNPFKISLPRPMIKSDNFDFSFSGLKTAVLYETKKHPDLLKNKDYISELCREFQQAVIDVLISKTIRAAKKHHPQTIMLAGGVSANTELRKQLGSAIGKELPNSTTYQILDTKYSLDNAAMIAAAGYYRYKSIKNKELLKNNWQSLEADANLKLE